MPPGIGCPPRGRADVNGLESPTRYELRVEDVLDGRWAAWFEGLQVTSDGQHTVISGLLIDQPALHGLLAKIRDMGLSLISVRRLDPDDAGHGGGWLARHGPCWSQQGPWPCSRRSPWRLIGPSGRKGIPAICR
jgi:hypothetical protein